MSDGNLLTSCSKEKYEFDEFVIVYEMVVKIMKRWLKEIILEQKDLKTRTGKKAISDYR